ncbi:ubiquinone/menaquinone biosynthesis C-methylase UbiE [Peribacillus deserti]|uniref:Ubiquinone/menaquinone biosynthesis C-methylase UbiE n=1 Tax=Peribacillus deserti TaxID=673318 RepID=A0ABS2QE36_9BACI|nr:class I SAM-dependent methyltransferase [Peribacillus deserti]MBM7691432.1 ubiquinone/menaquinone biosynthesis C-methylase UbiE [Peribacillus deserti]
MKVYGPDLFKGTAWYYSQYRPLYPPSLIRFLIQRFSLDGNGALLDLGCGNGRLALRFTDWFEQIRGVDTESEMIDEAKRLCRQQRVENMDWFIGDLEEFSNQDQTTFKLVTIAQAFHWMDRETMLKILYERIISGGGAAIIDYCKPNQEPLIWQRKVDEVVKHWYGNKRRAGDTTYSHPRITHEQMIKNSRFTLETHFMPTYEKLWTVEEIIGNLYSTSYGSKRFLGDQVQSFEADLNEQLLKLDDKGEFREKLHVSVKLALKE